MTVGTKSILFGVHQFLLHPALLAAGWFRLYGFPCDPRLWAAFLVHDLGYLGCTNMEGAEGERHPEFGARIMRGLFGESWGDFCLRHSRYYARARGTKISRLCVADKLAFAIAPGWLYLPMARASGELFEYMERAKERQVSGIPFTPAEWAGVNSADPRAWLAALQSYTRRWVSMAHREVEEDEWTACTALPSRQPQER